MNRRSARVFRNGTSLVVVIPADWARGEAIGEGDEVELVYNGEIHLRPKKRNASAGGASHPVCRARRPAQPTETDEGGLADVGC